jgi:hypothetical protein
LPDSADDRMISLDISLKKIQKVFFHETDAAGTQNRNEAFSFFLTIKTTPETDLREAVRAA